MTESTAPFFGLSGSTLFRVRIVPLGAWVAAAFQVASPARAAPDPLVILGLDSSHGGSFRLLNGFGLSERFVGAIDKHLSAARGVLRITGDNSVLSGIPRDGRTALEQYQRSLALIADFNVEHLKELAHQDQFTVSVHPYFGLVLNARQVDELGIRAIYDGPAFEGNVIFQRNAARWFGWRSTGFHVEELGAPGATVEITRVPVSLIATEALDLTQRGLNALQTSSTRILKPSEKGTSRVGLIARLLRLIRRR